MKTTKITYGVPVEGGPLVFNETPVEDLSFDDIVSNNDLKKLNWQKFHIRKSAKVTHAEVRKLEEGHQRFTKP